MLLKFLLFNFWCCFKNVLNRTLVFTKILFLHCMKLLCVIRKILQLTILNICTADIIMMVNHSLLPSEFAINDRSPSGYSTNLCPWQWHKCGKKSRGMNGRLWAATANLNEGMGALPSVGSRATPLVRGSGGLCLPEAEAFCCLKHDFWAVLLHFTQMQQIFY